LIRSASAFGPVNPKSVYATSKIAADFLTMNYVDAYGLPGVTTRMFNNYGPRQNPRYVTGTIITQALSKPVIEIGYTQAKRDFCFVTDGVMGHLSVALHGKPGEVYVYGHGSNITIRRPFYAYLPNVSSIVYMSDSGSLNYHSLQATFEHRYKNGLNISSNYTWAHALQSGAPGQVESNWSLEHGTSTLDIRHRSRARLARHDPGFRLHDVTQSDLVDDPAPGFLHSDGLRRLRLQGRRSLRKDCR